MAKTLRSFVNKIDFPRLRRQKHLLLELTRKLDTDDDTELRQRVELQGVVHLLDDLMDESAKVAGIGKLKVFGKSKNEGCLAGLKCPKCGYEDHMYITGETEFTVFDSGTDGHHDVEWDGFSWVKCGDGNCGHSGQMWEFQA